MRVVVDVLSMQSVRTLEIDVYAVARPPEEPADYHVRETFGRIHAHALAVSVKSYTLFDVTVRCHSNPEIKRVGERKGSFMECLAHRKHDGKPWFTIDIPWEVTAAEIMNPAALIGGFPRID